MKTNSNTYTLIYSAVIVIAVAFLLAFVNQALKSRQQANMALDQKNQILASLNIRNLGDEETERTYTKMLKNMQKQTNGTIYTFDLNGQTKYVLTIRGMGLWGGINGFIAIDADKSTVYGAYFNHESETAGLGAEIKDNQKWQEQFCGRHLFAGNDRSKIALSVMKKKTDAATQVDAVTGATLTSNGVSDMLHDTHKGLGQYLDFLNTDSN